MRHTIKDIHDLMKDKHICLFGNSRSVLKNKKAIDSKFDIICRINRGYSQGKAEYIGKRTDILFISTKFHEHLKRKFNAKYVVWMTKSIELATEWIKENAIMSPAEDWDRLKTLFYEDKLPSTGLLTLYFILKYAEFKSLTIYGFDFFVSGSWYHNLKNFPWHEGNIEKKIILEWIKYRNNVSIEIE